MEMEFMAEFTEGMSRDRARQIIKRKRTKRHRPCSPFAVSTTSGDTNPDGDYCLIDNNFAASDASTEEDEDMANCLIMLAQSVSPAKEEEKEKSDQIRQKTDRLSSRRFTEIGGGSKPGLYVYECKTCNRTFPSFQALGGHRASHKKPKLNVEEKKSSSVNNIINPPPLMEYVEEEDHDLHRVVMEDEENKASSIIVANNVQTGVIINSNSKGKVHECSICGSEFLSGQALGGHMRKHRPIPPPSGNRTVISIVNTDDSTADNQIIIEKSPPRLLSLDLNFPPPEVADDHRQSKFQFTANSSSSSSQHLVFSAPAFVDCHY